MGFDVMLSEYFKAQGINPRDGYDADDFYEWKQTRKAYAEYERLRPMREEQERRWVQQRHETVLQQAQRWAGDKVAGFVVFVGEFAASAHRDESEAKEIARANADFYRNVKIKRIKV